MSTFFNAIYKQDGVVKQSLLTPLAQEIPPSHHVSGIPVSSAKAEISRPGSQKQLPLPKSIWDHLEFKLGERISF